ncbi:MAG TPA: glycoside hydrolase family 30 protein [Halothiobacillus sp.]|nr:glycoside hydrolase family 30 protein [Halothiobacillus sp.]
MITRRKFLAVTTAVTAGAACGIPEQLFAGTGTQNNTRHPALLAMSQPDGKISMQKYTRTRFFLTAKNDGSRLTEQAPLKNNSEESGLADVSVMPHRLFQTIEGFGGAFTESAAVTWQALSPARRKEVLEGYFDRDAGHGYSLCRVHMNSCDFSLGNYAHVGTPGDVELRSFNIDRDRQALLPFIKQAQQVAGKPINLLISPWSPPAWMKSNGEMNHGGRLLPQYRQAWAHCFVRFIEEYTKEGLQVWGVSVQNEPAASQPWESCLYTAEEERDFVRDFLGPALSRAGLGHVRIIVWDHNRDLMVERASVVYSDPEAARYVWGTGFHWYGEDHFDHVQLVHDAWPDKQLLSTEGCQEGGPHLGSWDLGERYARSMINDLNRWTVGWIDWNLVLNEQGGPNHVGNFCSAPVIVDREHDAVLRQSSYYYLGHFSRFVKPGARRVLCASTRQNLEATAFINPDASIATVVMNRTETALRFALRVGEARMLAELPPRSIATYLTTASNEST